jgi:DNA-binding NtrC family response regulator
MSYRVVVADDDREMRASLEDLLESAGWDVRSVNRAERVAEMAKQFSPDVILTDVRMPGQGGLSLLDARPSDAPPVVVITAHGDIPMAVDAIHAGAYSFLEKPFDPRRLLTILDHAAEQHRLSHQSARLRLRLSELSGLDRVLLGETPEVRDLREDILDLVDVRGPVMLRGETGTGKELVARALHDLGPNAVGPFVVVNCATLPPDKFATIMFGDTASQGLMAAADGGTLFLDEIGACPSIVQAQLLRVIEASEVLSVGATQSVVVDAHIISATNTDLEAAVRAETFRADLLFRLNTHQVSLPTLRDRRSDIALLYTHFAAQSAAVYETNPPTITPEDMSALLAHDWPGNVRELRHVAERRVLAARRGRGSVAQALSGDESVEDLPGTLREAVAAFERQMIGNAISAHSGRMDAVAEALGIGRRTLNEKIVKLDLDKDALL